MILLGGKDRHTLIPSVVGLRPSNPTLGATCDENAGQGGGNEKMGPVPGDVAGGEIATSMGTAHFDVVNGKGTYFGYLVATFQDGATLIYKTGGTVAPIDGGKKAAFEGTYEYAGGTGRFAGTKGKGTFKGERIGSPKTGGDTHGDFTGTEWK
jgi:hypothetical protein